jgi:DHA2 family multidrug resistance protein-like MFS transporter
MAGLRLPAFIAEVVDDRPALRTLVAATIALAAGGLNPQVTSPFVVDVQSAIRAQPELLAVSSLVAVLGAGMILAGGVAADAFRTRRILFAALAILATAAAVSALVTSGPAFTASRFAGAMAAGLVIPFGIAAVATVYSGTARATAIGFAYAGLGGGMALPPILLTITGPGGSDLPAYLACGLVAALALWLGRFIPNLPGADAASVPAVARIAVWAFGIISLTAGIASVGSGMNPVRLALIAVGVVAMLIGAFLEWRARENPSNLVFQRRPVTVVLAAGLFIGFAQTVPMTVLPAFFQLILAFGPVLGVVAIGPIIVALVLAGPIAGWLLPRTSPRALIGGGLVAVGLGDLVIALVASRGASYLLFILPFLMVGAGFVVATTVRTAVIFASVPAKLPASAAALNEASVGLGSRIGILVASVILTEAAIASFAGSLPPGTDVAAASEPLRGLLVALGTPNFTALVSGADQDMLGAYAAAYINGIKIVHLVAGGFAVVAGIVVTLALGRTDPLRGMWEHHD